MLVVKDSNFGMTSVNDLQQPQSVEEVSQSNAFSSSKSHGLLEDLSNVREINSYSCDRIIHRRISCFLNCTLIL